MITGIVVALPEELETLKVAYPHNVWKPKKMLKGDCVFISPTVLVAYSGAGTDNARLAAENLVSAGATHLISWGCAGALSADLKPGDLILSEQVQDSNGITLAINTRWHQQAEKKLSTSLSVYTGTLLESGKLIAFSRDKKQLHEQTKAIAVDMESLTVADVAKHYTLPFLVIRAIADPVDMELPEAVSYALNEQGDVVLGRLLAFLARHPIQIFGLIKLGLHFNAAKNTLKKVASQLDDLIVR